MRVSLIILVILLAGSLSHAEEGPETSSPQDSREAKDGFLSNAFSDAFTKINQYSSGEKSILLSEDELQEEDMDYYAMGASRHRPPRRTARQVRTPPPDEE